jgi:Radical SAM superfamily
MNKDFRILLTNPPLNMAETPLQYHRPLAPLGLAYIGAMLENAVSGGAWGEYVEARVNDRRPRGYEPTGCVAAIDNMLLSFYGKFRVESFFGQVRRYSMGVAPDRFFIGFSILSDGMWAAKQMLLRLRQDFPLAKIIVGGPHATFFPYDFYKYPESRRGPLVDYVVRNEGEKVITGIVKEEFADLQGLRAGADRYAIQVETSDYSDPDYKIIDGGQYRGERDVIGLNVLDDLPVPAYFLFEDEDGRLPYEPDRRYNLASPAANINSSRGCPHKCTFCTIPKLAPGYRSLSPGRMIEIIQFLVKEYSVQSLFFREDNFMYSGGGVKGDRWGDIDEFCSRLREVGSQVHWAIEARADNLLQSAGNSGARIDVLRAAGLSGVYVGVESGSDLMLKLYAKGADTRTMSEALKACKSRGIATVATACYSDPDLLLRARYPLIDPVSPACLDSIVRQREAILAETRAFMDRHQVPLENREEYAMVGIPVSVTYNVIAAEAEEFPWLIEHRDPDSRYLYPKGFGWWSTKVYETKRLVRPYIGFGYHPRIL